MIAWNSEKGNCLKLSRWALNAITSVLIRERRGRFAIDKRHMYRREKRREGRERYRERHREVEKQYEDRGRDWNDAAQECWNHQKLKEASTFSFQDF